MPSQSSYVTTTWSRRALRVNCCCLSSTSRPGVTITLRGDGSFSVDIGAGTTLASLERKGLLRLTVEHIKFEVISGKLLVHIGGTVTLLIGDEEWPTFRADDISIDAGGNISMHGAGLELKNGKPLDLGASPAGTGPVPGVTIDKLALSGNPLDGGLIVDAELSTVTNAGPFTGTLQQIGVHARLAARLSGPGAKVDDLSFRPPTRIAIAVDSERVSGGGLISRDVATDTQKIEYSGIVELQIAEKIAVKAIGLLTTRLPDGSKGYSLLIIITVEGFQPIPLPLGFRLTGIGGLLALHRTFAEDALRSGLKNHALDSVMFPQGSHTQRAANPQQPEQALPDRHRPLSVRSDGADPMGHARRLSPRRWQWFWSSAPG